MTHDRTQNPHRRPPTDGTQETEGLSKLKDALANRKTTAELGEEWHRAAEALHCGRDWSQIDHAALGSAPHAPRDFVNRPVCGSNPPWDPDGSRFSRVRKEGDTA
jgi:hypothetical protein